MRPFVPSSWELLENGVTVSIESESLPGQFYFVGLKSLKCSCPSARNGRVCKHARWVYEHRAEILSRETSGLFSENHSCAQNEHGRKE